MPGFVVSRLHCALIGALAITTGCRGSNPVVPDPHFPMGAVDVAWSSDGAGRVAHAYYSGFTAPARLVIDNDADWRAAWAQAYAGMAPTPALPAIDFSRSSVIVVALGGHATGGYNIVVSRLATTADHLYAEVTSTAPGSKCITTQTFTQPFDMVRIPRPPGPVAFVERAVTHAC
jgi:hypothetical protein